MALDRLSADRCSKGVDFREPALKVVIAGFQGIFLWVLTGHCAASHGNPTTQLKI